MTDEENELFKVYEEEERRFRNWEPKKHPPNPFLKEPWQQVESADIEDLVEIFDGFLGYPRHKTSFAQLCGQLAAMCGTRERVEWLVKRAFAGCTRCPTAVEFRRLLHNYGECADGVHPDEADISKFMGDGRS
jgi:hypothetical protein